jgi:hypothetical protein
MHSVKVFKVQVGYLSFLLLNLVDHDANVLNPAVIRGNKLAIVHFPVLVTSTTVNARWKE